MDDYWTRTPEERIAYDQGRQARQDEQSSDPYQRPGDWFSMALSKAWRDGWEAEDELLEEEAA